MTRLRQAHEWILHKLAQHKPPARPVASYGFGRLPQFYSGETVASIKVVEVPPKAGCVYKSSAEQSAGLRHCLPDPPSYPPK